MDIYSIINRYICDFGITHFNKLKLEQKRELAAIALVEGKYFDAFRLIDDHDDNNIFDFLYQYQVKKSLTAFDVVEKTLDGIIERHSSEFQEIFDEINSKYEIDMILDDFHEERYFDSLERARDIRSSTPWYSL